MAEQNKFEQRMIHPLTGDKISFEEQTFVDQTAQLVLQGMVASGTKLTSSPDEMGKYCYRRAFELLDVRRRHCKAVEIDYLEPGRPGPILALRPTIFHDKE